VRIPGAHDRRTVEDVKKQEKAIGRATLREKVFIREDRARIRRGWKRKDNAKLYQSVSK
jgi:hypothetical protein